MVLTDALIAMARTAARTANRIEAAVKREDAPYSDRVPEEEIAVENAGNEQDWFVP